MAREQFQIVTEPMYYILLTLTESLPTVKAEMLPSAKSSLSKGILRVALQKLPETVTSRQSCRCGVKCSTWRRPVWTRCTVMKSWFPWYKPWAAVSAKILIFRSFVTAKLSLWPMLTWTVRISVRCCLPSSSVLCGR